MDQQPHPARRSVRLGAGLAPVACLSACAAGGSGGPGTASAAGPDVTGGAATADAGAGAGQGGAQPAAGGVTPAPAGSWGSLALDAVPVGGFVTATATEGKPVVVVRPRSGQDPATPPGSACAARPT
ncbi:MAG TPA: hypothetical protein VFP72_16435 [Kineosporiaceae bacterium]|nr:hypothetical protein [Kineosporiaceae bacterium]